MSAADESKPWMGELRPESSELLDGRRLLDIASLAWRDVKEREEAETSLRVQARAIT